jgi:hypothetical protein
VTIWEEDLIWDYAGISGIGFGDAVTLNTVLEELQYTGEHGYKPGGASIKGRGVRRS